MSVGQDLVGFVAYSTVTLSGGHHSVYTCVCVATGGCVTDLPPIECEAGFGGWPLSLTPAGLTLATKGSPTGCGSWATLGCIHPQVPANRFPPQLLASPHPSHITNELSGCT